MSLSTPNPIPPRRRSRPPKNRRISAGFWSTNCWRSVLPMRISMNTAMSMRPFPQIATSRCRSSVSARIWIRRPISPARASSRRSSGIMPAAISSLPVTAEHPELNNQIGNDIVTTDGTTLLGADDKAGLAEIMTAARILIDNPDIRHGTIKILFTPDEEVGRGVNKVDLKKLGADFAYTMDGETAGHIEDETFSADGVEISISGVAIHPGFAKDRMENAIKIAGAIIDRLPKDVAPETTEGKQGFIHPVGVTGSMEKASLSFIIRDFTEEGLVEKEAMLEAIVKEVMAAYPGSTSHFQVTEQYRNMKAVLDRHPEIVENALEAVRRAGMTPVRGSIRGGTDGSRLSFMGLPCPNIFAGGHAFHSPLEWVSRQDMEKAVNTIVELARVWEERA
ncbi:peptidase M20 family protein (plasmid) [Rhizobium phaseoli Brasil 5]|nr:peptidase M20 family protein [Rhizobium phaseoli Brasil 5]